MAQEIHYAVMALHLTVGFVLVYLAAKAFKKTKYPPMALLVIGFSLIVVGDTIIGDVMEFLEQGIFGEVLSEGIEILGFIVLILAVKRS
ncbi:MAG: hypothetical protein K8Q89_08080 [Nitrosarchaeum sp.]|nr:hypothetical protein [Nitrosarchaeum sp.]